MTGQRLRRHARTSAALVASGAVLLAIAPAYAAHQRTLPGAQVRATHSAQHAATHGTLGTDATATVIGAANSLPRVVAPQQISSDSNPKVTDAAGVSQTDTQTEPSIAADPRGGRDIVMVTQQGRFDNGGSSAPGYAHSGDGGTTWQTHDLDLTKVSGGIFDRGSDTVVVFGGDGTAYAVTLVFDVSDCDNAIAVQTSHDGGATFGDPAYVARNDDCTIQFDKEWIVVDTNKRSPHQGRVYVVWDEYRYLDTYSEPEILRYSDDHGHTWSDAVTVNDHFGAYPVPLVTPDGSVVVTHINYDQTDSYPVGVGSNRSTDGGNTFAPDVIVTDSYNDGGPSDLRYGGVPNAAVDATTGKMYVVWDDNRFNAQGRDDVVMSVSSNGGRSWGKVSDVTPSGKGSQVDALTPMVAADHSRVYVSYLARDEATTETADHTHTYITASHNNGNTFGPSYPLGPQSDLAYAPLAPAPFPGDYSGLVTANNKVYAAWAVSSEPPTGSDSPTHQVTWGAVLPQW